ERRRRKVQRHRYRLRKPQQHALAVEGVREEERIRQHWLMRGLLRAVVERGFQRVEVPQPHRLFAARLRGIEASDDDPVLAKLVLKPAVTEKRQRVRRVPYLLTSLLRSKD